MTNSKIMTHMNNDIQALLRLIHFKGEFVTEQTPCRGLESAKRNPLPSFLNNSTALALAEEDGSKTGTPRWKVTPLTAKVALATFRRLHGYGCCVGNSASLICMLLFCTRMCIQTHTYPFFVLVVAPKTCCCCR